MIGEEKHFCLFSQKGMKRSCWSLGFPPLPLEGSMVQWIGNWIMSQKNWVLFAADVLCDLRQATSPLFTFSLNANVKQIRN